MSVSVHNSLNTTSSSLGHHDITMMEKSKCYVKEIIKSRIFLGRYMERRLINEQIGYRDVVLISKAEVELNRDLLEVQQKLRSVCPSTYWVGISDSELLGYDPPGLCIWTEIDNKPFGPFWFQVKSIKFRENEVIILVKCLRHLNEAFLELEPILTGGTKHSSNHPKSECTTALLSDTNDIVKCLKSAVTISNVKEFVTFIFALIFAIFTGSTSFVNFLGTFILALVREMSVFVKNTTPAFLGFLDFIGKIVGGFYILIAMMFKPNTPSPFSQRRIPYEKPSHHQSPYNHNLHFD